MSLLIQASPVRTSRPVSAVRKDTCATLVRQAAQRTVATLCAERSASCAREMAFMAMVRANIARGKAALVVDVVIPCDRAGYLLALRVDARMWTGGEAQAAE